MDISSLPLSSDFLFKSCIFLLSFIQHHLYIYCYLNHLLISKSIWLENIFNLYTVNFSFLLLIVTIIQIPIRIIPCSYVNINVSNNGIYCPKMLLQEAFSKGEKLNINESVFLWLWKLVTRWIFPCLFFPPRDGIYRHRKEPCYRYSVSLVWNSDTKHAEYNVRHMGEPDNFLFNKGVR